MTTKTQTPSSSSPVVDRPGESPEERAYRRRFRSQQATIVQILKDRVTRYDKSRQSHDPSRSREIPENEVSYGHSHLTSEGLRENDLTRSQRLVERELDRLRYSNELAYWYIDTYFGVDSGHSDLDDLKQKAKISNRAKRDYYMLEVAVGVLTLRLLDEDLYCVFGDRLDTRTNRTRTMETQYEEYYRVFASWKAHFEQIADPRPTTNAYENTAHQMKVSKPTVERAVKFMRKKIESEGGTPA